jgi:hypothetical protein
MNLFPDQAIDRLPLPLRIWAPWDQPARRMAFSRTFDCQVNTGAVLFVSASGPYSAWLDGQPLQVPGAWMPSWRSMHQIPLNLTPDAHQLCFEAIPGNHGQPFFLACLDWEEGRQPLRVATNAEWQMLVDPADGWAHQPMNADWLPAWAFDGVWAEPWGMPCNAPLDFCRFNLGLNTVERQPLVQVAGLFQGLVTQGAYARLLPGGALMLAPAWPHALQPPVLENTRPRQEWYRTREAHSLINNTWLDLFEPRAPHVVLDAGKETFARLRVSVRSGGPAILAITSGESINEVQRYARRVTDIVALRDGESFTTTPDGFRYAKIVALSCDPQVGAVILEPVEIQHVRYPVERAKNGLRKGSFTCSDPLLNEVWALSERTVHLCMQNEVWDGIKRDQLPWMGDLYTEALAIYHLFGDARLVRHTLEILAEIGPVQPRPLATQRYAGLVAIWKGGGGSHPGSDSGSAIHGDINGIPSYTLWWVIGLHDYIQYTGDDSLTQAVAAELEATLSHIQDWVGEDGIWRFQGGWDFVDWSPVPRAEREIFCHLLACHALQVSAGLLERIGRPADQLRLTQARMTAAARLAWLREDGGFGASHHVNAMAIRSGILGPQESARVFAQALAHDPPYSMTYWHRYLDLEAAARAGQVQWGLDYIRKHWGLSLQLGLTTLWEAFDSAWIGPDPHAVSMVGGEYARYGGYETSLCHGWSAGPAVWLHQAILGVRPSDPGFAAVDFHPALGDLEWARGEIPTPQGMLRVELRKLADGTLSAEIDAPPGVEVRG